MKGISDIDKLGIAKTQALEKKSDESNGEVFKQALERALGAGEESGVTSTSATGVLGEIQAVGFQMVSDETSDTLEQETSRLLNLFDDYSKALSDPEQTLKDIEPLLNELKSGAEQLSEMVSRNQPGSDNKLASIAQESALLANVEYIKFMRGDYV